MSHETKNNIYFFEFCYAGIPHVFPHVYGHLRLYSERSELILENYHWCDPILKWDGFLDEIESPKVVLFSVYMWNEQRTLKAAQAIKEKYPETLVILGGPHIGSMRYKLDSDHGFIDLLVIGEGEQTLVHILEENLKVEKDWSSIKGIEFFDGNSIARTEPADRVPIVEMTESPYEKYFEYYKALAENEFKNSEITLAVIETNRGCPYQCAFCNWGTLTANKIFQFPLEKIEKDFKYISLLKPDILQMADANFGILPRDKEVSEILVKNFDANNPFQTKFSINYAKNFNNKVLDAYSEMKKGKWKAVSPVNVNVQSLNKASLKAIKRDNIGFENFLKKLELTKDYFEGENIACDFLIPLPHETKDSFVDGALYCYSVGISSFIIFSLVLLPGTEISTEENIEKYQFQWEFGNTIDDRFYENDEDFFQEREKVVVSTSTMTKSEIIYCMMFVAVLGRFDNVIQKIIPKESQRDPKYLKPLIDGLLEELCLIDEGFESFKHGDRNIHNLWNKISAYLKIEIKANPKFYLNAFMKTVEKNGATDQV